MIDLLTAMYIGFGGSFLGSIVLYTLNMKLFANKDVVLKRRLNLFEDIVKSLHEFALASNPIVKDNETSERSLKGIDEKFLKISGFYNINYDFYKINRKYKNRIEKILDLAVALHSNIANKKVYLDENKMILQNIKDKIWALTDKLKTDRDLFEL
ncbi:hypothetical protein JXB41_04360 [Candidatus Woesearchaeota archaeon]|nr:hypothetical protein [Candidatus Woesearchaeota archaeon]